MSNYFDNKGRNQDLSRKEEFEEHELFEIQAQYYLNKIGQLIICVAEKLAENELRLQLEDDFAEHLEISESRITQRYFNGDCIVTLQIDRKTTARYLHIEIKNSDECRIIRDAFLRSRMRDEIAGTYGIQQITILCSTNNEMSAQTINTNSVITQQIPVFHSRAETLLLLLTEKTTLQ